MSARFAGRLVLVALGIAILGITAWQTRSLWRVRAEPSASSSPPSPAALTSRRILAEGRLEACPGARVTVSSEVAGVLTNILVQEKSSVNAGDLLVEIKADDVYASLMESRARVVEIEAEIRLATSELRRGKGLAASEAITPQELERLEQALETLQARHTTALVTVKRLETTLAKTRILAPIGGVVLARYLHAGEVVGSGTPLVTLVDLSRTRLEVEVDEYDAGRVQRGATVLIRAEGYDRTWHGRVEEIPDSVNPRALHPQDPARPSDVRVLLVKVALQDPTPLKLGQRVEVEIQCE